MKSELDGNDISKACSTTEVPPVQETADALWESIRRARRGWPAQQKGDTWDGPPA